MPLGGLLHCRNKPKVTFVTTMPLAEQCQIQGWAVRACSASSAPQLRYLRMRGGSRRRPDFSAEPLSSADFMLQAGVRTEQEVVTRLRCVVQGAWSQL